MKHYSLLTYLLIQAVIYTPRYRGTLVSLREGRGEEVDSKENVILAKHLGVGNYITVQKNQAWINPCYVFVVMDARRLHADTVRQ